MQILELKLRNLNSIQLSISLEDLHTLFMLSFIQFMFFRNRTLKHKSLKWVRNY